MSTGKTTVGEIVGLLRLDSSAWSAEIDDAKRQADTLAKSDPKISIKVDSATALSQLAAVAAATKRLQDAQGSAAVAQAKLNALRDTTGGVGNEAQTLKISAAEEALAKAMRSEESASISLAAAHAKVTQSTQDLQTASDKAANSLAKTKKAADDARGSISPLVTTLALLGPAVVPLAAVAAAGLGALALGAGVALLAVKGISAEMKAGTADGVQYTTGIAALKSNLGQLEQTASINVLGPFNTAVKDAGQLMPGLNREVGLFAKVLGTDAVSAVHGIAGGFVTLSPLLNQLALQSEHLLADFDKYANGGGLAKFEAWTQANLPAVESDISQVAQAVAKLITASAAMGVTGLGAFGTLARVINALPIGALQILLPLVTDTYIAFQAYKGLSSVGDTLDKIGASTLQFAANAGLASAGADALAVSETEVGAAAVGADLSMSALLGPIGAVVVGVGLLAATFLSGSKNTAAAKAEIDSLTQSIQQDNGAIGDNTKANLANTIAKSGAIEAGKTLGITTDQITAAIVNGGPALTALEASLKDVIQRNIQLADTNTTGVGATKGATQASQAQADAAQKLLDVLTGQNGALGDAVTQSQAQQAVMAALGLTTSGTAAQTFTMASAIDAQNRAASNTALQGLTSAMDTFSKSEDTAADKGQLLSAVLVASQGDALAYSGAVAAGYSADSALITAFQGQASQLAQQSKQAASNASSASAAQGKAKDGLTAANSRLNASETKLAAVQASSKSTAAQVASAEAAVASARTSVDGATISLTSAGAAASAAGLAFADTELGAINLQTGMINLKSAGAGPLIQQLQAMQDAAAKAATATYQHELATKGDSAALQDAQDLFESMTGGTLVANAKQLGLTGKQAQTLADNYFKFDGKTVTTQVQAIGLDDINDTLVTIGKLLAAITGTKWTLAIDAAPVGQTAHDIAAGEGVFAPPTAKAGVKPILKAAGGPIYGRGTGTSDSIAAWLSAGEYVMPTDKTAKYRPMLDAMHAGVPITAPPSSSSSKSYDNGHQCPPQTLTTYLTLDGKVIAKSVNEVNSQNARR